MRLWAISDLHVGHPDNRRALAGLSRSSADWLILAGDVGETLAHLRYALDVVTDRFARVLWVPGNHELWTMPGEELVGQAKYEALVALCRSYGVLTPEDPFPIFPGEEPHLLAPLFVLYDYSFAPEAMSPERALAWADEHGLRCADEDLLHPDPHPSPDAWCRVRLAVSEARLARACGEHGLPVVLINHFPLRREHASLPRIPRFAIWCGTRRTESWPERYGARIAVYGHLHIRRTHHLAGVRYEEVSLGYPGQWDPARGIDSYLRPILP